MVQRHKDRKAHDSETSAVSLAIPVDVCSNPQRDVESKMRPPSDAILLRAFLGEDDTYGSRPLYQAIVLKAREMHLAGATVFRGPLGFGHSTRVQSASLFHMSRDLPIVIEIVDTQDKIDSFLPALNEMMPGGIVTLEKAKILKYGPNEMRNDAAGPHR
jgi:uncharacterized protein